MQENRSIKRGIFIFTALALILLTRLPGLMHNSFLHPDEPVFYNSARSLAAFLTGQADSYTPTKFYPEGGFVLHMPFQLLQLLFGNAEEDGRFMGRIGGCIYFLLGTAMVLQLLRKFFTKELSASAVYLATMLFGLMHIEQSRYTTGDTGSFFLLMVLLYFSARGMETERLRYFLLAAAAGGMLTAIKYPLIFFLLIPYLGFRKVFSGSDKKARFLGTWKAAGCFLLGFLLLSPKTLTDPTFLFWTAAHETHNYMAGTNLTEVGGPGNHLLSVSLYTLLYSGVPLLTGVTIWQAGKNIRSARHMQGCDYLFRFLIPLITAGFFVYNLFVTAVFMRTYYPFFVIVDLYCAALCGKWLRQKGAKRIAVVILCLFMALRGGYYLYILAEDSGKDAMQEVISSIPEEQYTSIIELKPGKMAFFQEDLPEKAFQAMDLTDERFDTPEGMVLREGELLISTYQEYGIGTPYCLPISHSTVQSYIDRWTDFKQINGQYEVGRLYPDSYYTLFGFWIKGTTGMYFEFPCNIFYLRPIQ